MGFQPMSGLILPRLWSPRMKLFRLFTGKPALRSATQAREAEMPVPLLPLRFLCALRALRGRTIVLQPPRLKSTALCYN